MRIRCRLRSEQDCDFFRRKKKAFYTPFCIICIPSCGCNFSAEKRFHEKRERAIKNLLLNPRIVTLFWTILSFQLIERFFQFSIHELLSVKIVSQRTPQFLSIIPPITLFYSFILVSFILLTLVFLCISYFRFFFHKTIIIIIIFAILFNRNAFRQFCSVAKKDAHIYCLLLIVLVLKIFDFIKF